MGYVGDGANDTLALKEADVGLSLSQADASLAAPFVSTDPEITSVENLLLEGRAALACNFQNFKYFLFYCITQAMGVMILSYFLVDFSNLAYLWMDIVVAIPLTCFLALLKTKRKLGSILPLDTLISLSTLLSFFIHIIFGFAVILTATLIIQQDGNYRTPDEILA